MRHTSINIKSPNILRLNTLLDYSQINANKKSEAFESDREAQKKLKVEIPLFKLPNSAAPYTTVNSRITYAIRFYLI